MKHLRTAFREGGFGPIHVESSKGEIRKASEWLPAGGRALALKSALVTNRRFPVATVALVKAKGMKDAWFLASSLSVPASTLIKLYGR